MIKRAPDLLRFMNLKQAEYNKEVQELDLYYKELEAKEAESAPVVTQKKEWQPDDLLVLNDLAELLGISLNTAYQKQDSLPPPSFKIGQKKWRYSAILRWMVIPPQNQLIFK